MLTIRNYGHYWSRELIDWGAGRRAGTLFGSRSAAANRTDVNFRNQVAIYVLFDEDREAVYIGQTGSGRSRLFNRLKQHSRGPLRDRWSNFSWFGFLEPRGDGPGLKPASRKKNAMDAQAEALESDIAGSHADALDEIEASLLQVIEPRLNKQGPKWKDSTEYFQYDPFDPEPSRSELAKVLNEIRRTMVTR